MLCACAPGGGGAGVLRQRLGPEVDEHWTQVLNLHSTHGRKLLISLGSIALDALVIEQWLRCFTSEQWLRQFGR